MRAVVAADVHQRLRDAVDERLAADEAVIGQHVGARGEMLAAAEADLEVQRAGHAEQALGGDRASSGTAICGSSVSTSACCPARRDLPFERP
jgi:hypothetical protein